MIDFKFNEKKTTQVASLFLKKRGGKMSYMKLIKLMYFADRDALINWDRPITGDTYFSMKHGPVLSNVLDIISNGNDPDNDSYWYKYITSQSNFEIALKEGKCPEPDMLNERELEIIDIIYDKFGAFSRWDLVAICHDHDLFPEWEDVGDTSKLIEIDEIFRKEKKSEEDIKEIAEEVANMNYAKKLLSIED